MKIMKALVGATASFLLAAGANAAVIQDQVVGAKLGNQFTQGGGGSIPDVAASNAGGFFTYDTDTQMLVGWQRHQSNASQGSYLYQAGWSVDLAASQMTTANTSCTFLAGNDACPSFTNGLQPGPASVLAGNIGNGAFGNLVTIKWNTLGAPLNSAFIATQIQAVPVPAAAWLFGSALAAAGVLRRRMAT